MKKIYVDASFDYRLFENEKEKVFGYICIADHLNLRDIQRVVIGKVPGLRQYINILELIAIGRGIHAMISQEVSGDLEICSDSLTAISWTRKGKIKQAIRTPAHEQALQYINDMKSIYNGDIKLTLVPRDLNVAGHIIEENLDKLWGNKSVFTGQ